MVGRKLRFEIEIMIIQALEDRSQLRYTDLREKIDSRCQVLGLKKPSNDAFYSRLTNLCYKDVLIKEKDEYGGAHYSYKRSGEDILIFAQVSHDTLQSGCIKS
jgi:hypothetical protein